MPNRLPPGWLELRNEMALRAAIRDRYVKEANKLPFHEVKPMPAITEADIERMRQEMQIDDQGRVVMPPRKPPEIRMEKGGSLRTRLLNYAVPSALTAGSEDPVDYATLFGSLKANVPAALAAYHKSVNEDEEAELARRLGPAGFYARSSGRAFGTPLEREPVGANDLSLAITKQELRAMNPHLDSMSPAEKARAVKNYYDYKAIEAMGMPRYQSGGGVKKQAVDLARRNFLRLRDPSPVDLPQHLRAMVISKQGDKALTKLESDLAKFHAENPDVFSKAIETPVTRRSVLQSAVGQVARNALPVGEIIPSVAKAAEAVAPTVVGHDMIPGLVMTAIKRGIPENEVASFVRSQLTMPYPSKKLYPDDPQRAHLDQKDMELMLLHRNLSDPMDAPSNYEFEGPLRPSNALDMMLNPYEDKADLVQPMKLRGALRQIREIDPERYRQLIDTAKDFSMGTAEETYELGMMTPKNLEKYMRGEHAEPKYRPRHLWFLDE